MSKKKAGARTVAKPSRVRTQARRSADRNGSPAVPAIPLLPLRGDVVFPQTVVPLIVNRPAGIRLIDEAMLGDKLVGLVTQKDPEVEEPTEADLHTVFCVGTILKMLKFPDGSTRIVVQGNHRARLGAIQALEPYLVADAVPLEESEQPASRPTPWSTTSPACSTGWSRPAARCPRSFRSPP